MQMMVSTFAVDTDAIIATLVRFNKEYQHMEWAVSLLSVLQGGQAKQ